VVVALTASLLPGRSPIRASNNIDPSEGLSFSGAVVVNQVTTLKTSDTAGLQSPVQNNVSTDFVHAGLASGDVADSSGFSAGLLSPVDPAGVASSLAPSEEATPAANEQAAPAVPSDCDTSVSAIYCVSTVEEGDTLSGIAGKFGLTSTEDVANYELLVQSNKPDIVSADDPLQPGQKIRVPLHNGAIHTVLTSQTLTDIADEYGQTIEAIMAVPENGIIDANAIGIGTEILIPNPTRFAPTFVADETASNSSSGDSSESTSSSDQSTSSGPEITGGGATSASGFIWPVAGPISSYFGPSHPLGIDIDLFHNVGAPISAAMGGVVTFAGGNPCCSYGNYVVIDHGNGFQTLYAHLSTIAVSAGEVVAQGQYLGGGGTTGYSTGPHLHFEVHLNGSVVDPLKYLP
jgi:murein DD-endopeptidase MepM/ murein hydrolase activator NlpD